MTGAPYKPTGPLDPVAEQIAGFFSADPVWQGRKSRPMAETRAALKAATPPSEPRPVARVEDFSIPSTGGEIGLRFYCPAPNPPAVLLWAHGGGFALGSLDESDAFARALALATGCAVATMDYRLAPEHKFPAALEDVIAATRWMDQKRAELVGPNALLVLGGDSAGANLATVATRKLHEAKACAIAANVLAYPSTEGGDAESLRRFEPPFLGVDDVTWFFEQYLPDASAQTNPDFAPARAANLKLLPPTFIITAEHDILTEQAEAYGEKLAGEGVDVRKTRYPGMIHGFLTLEFFFAGAAGAAMSEISDFVGDVARRSAR